MTTTAKSCNMAVTHKAYLAASRKVREARMALVELEHAESRAWAAYQTARDSAR